MMKISDDWLFQICQCGYSKWPRDVLRPPPHPGRCDGQQDQTDGAPQAGNLQVRGCARMCWMEGGINKLFVRALDGKIMLRLDNLSWISRSSIGISNHYFFYILSIWGLCQWSGDVSDLSVYESELEGRLLHELVSQRDSVPTPAISCLSRLNAVFTGLKGNQLCCCYVYGAPSRCSVSRLE